MPYSQPQLIFAGGTTRLRFMCSDEFIASHQVKPLYLINRPPMPLLPLLYLDKPPPPKTIEQNILEYVDCKKGTICFG
jgi:hypothetical protein